MNIVQFRAPSTPAPKDPPVMPPSIWPNRPPATPKSGSKKANVLKFTPKLAPSGVKKLESLQLIARCAARCGLTPTDLAAFFGGRTMA